MKKLALHLTPLIFTFALIACSPAESQTQNSTDQKHDQSSEASPGINDPAKTEAMVDDAIDPATSGGLQTAIFAGGCFWCVESDFEKLEGVNEVVSGYTGGTTVNPTYREVGHGGTGHYEAAEIFFDPSVITYKQLLDYYWKTVDPTDAKGQFCDKGESYRTAIFASPDQKPIAEESLSDIKQSKPFTAPIVTPVKDRVPFYKAEDYHQDYYKTNSRKYEFYRTRCGRDSRIEDLWGEVVSH